MAVILPSEQIGVPLSLEQAEAIFASIFRASVSVTIDASGNITIPGSGRYKVLPNSGSSDDLTAIILTGEAVEGTLVQLRPQTVGHTITIKHQANLHLANEQDQSLPTIYSTMWLRHHGGNVWAQEGVVTYTI